MLMSLKYCLENLMNYLNDKILSKFFEILSVLILSPILIICIILGLINWLINLLNDTFYFLPSDLRNLIRKQRKVIKNQRKDIEYLKEKLNEKK